MTRAQIEAARERVWRVLDDRMTSGIPEWANLGSGDRDTLCSRLVTAVLGHPDGRAPKVAPKRKLPWPRRASR